MPLNETLPMRDAGDAPQSILPIILPPQTLRPVAFRTFAKKHDLTLTSSALNLLAKLIGRHCGSAWRDHGFAEKILDDVARAWKKTSNAVIVEGTAPQFGKILDALGPRIKNGRLEPEIRSNGPENGVATLLSGQGAPPPAARALPEPSADKSKADDWRLHDPRHWLVVVDAFEQPRLSYNASKNQFHQVQRKVSLLPDPSAKTTFFRDQYTLVHQRLMKNAAFQSSRPAQLAKGTSGNGVANMTANDAYKITPIANMLGRGGSRHVLLGLLVLSPTGMLAVSDLSGSVALDLSRAKAVPAARAWFAPGMFAVIEGVYKEDGGSGAFAGKEGVGGTIGGKFLGLSIGGPPCERREHTLGYGTSDDASGGWTEASGGGFGWVDFLGQGSEKAVGTRMRKMERDMRKLSSGNNQRARIVVLGECGLDDSRTLQGLKKVLAHYDRDDETAVPMAFIIAGNFAPRAILAGSDGSSAAACAELFESLASLLSEFPRVLRAAKFVFVPGDTDPWESAFSADAATLLPRKRVPEAFTAKVQRAFAAANAEVQSTRAAQRDGEAVWTTNPARLSFLGPVHELVVLRDNFSARMRRSALRFADDDEAPEEPNATPDEAGGGDSQPREEGLDTPIDDAVMDAESHVPSGDARTEQQERTSELETARKIVKTLLDQGHLSPFPLQKRPVLWDAAAALRLYPLPTALVLCDPDAPTMSITYEGCRVMNPGRLVADSRKPVARWIEYDPLTRRSQTVEEPF